MTIDQRAAVTTASKRIESRGPEFESRHPDQSFVSARPAPSLAGFFFHLRFRYPLPP